MKASQRLQRAARALFVVSVFLVGACAPPPPPERPEGKQLPPVGQLLTDEDLAGRKENDIPPEEENEAPTDEDLEESLERTECEGQGCEFTRELRDGGNGETETPPPTGTQFRAGTWNVRLLTPKRARDTVAPGLGGGLNHGTGTRWEAVIGLMAAASIHVLAVQEVYVNRLERRLGNGPANNVNWIGKYETILHEQATDHPLLSGPDPKGEPSGETVPTSWASYRIIKGDPVFSFGTPAWRDDQGEERRSLRMTRTEYCPIIYDTNRLQCSEGGNQAIGHRRHIHFATCKTNDDQIQFRFGCAHFAANAKKTADNITEAVDVMTALGGGKTIVGGDFNSYRFGGKHGTWETAAGQPPKIDLRADTRVKGAFSKISRKDDEIVVRADPTWVILDDIVWNELMSPFYVSPSKQVLDHGKTLDDQSFLGDHLDTASDHLAVIADFASVETDRKLE